MVEVEDDGVGFDVKKWEASGDKKKSAGIRNITFRVQSISKAHLTIESEINKGTKATIKFPDRGGWSINNENVMLIGELLAIKQFEMECEKLPWVNIAGKSRMPNRHWSMPRRKR